MLRKIYYGWWVVLATFLTLFVCAGIGFFTFTVFLKNIEAEMHWSRTSLSIAGALAALAAGFTAPVVGYALDRYSARAVMIPGALVLSVSFLLLGRINAVHQLYILFLTVGIGMSATTLLPSQTLVSRWFEQKRGRAMGIVVVASALGGMVWMPVSSHLIGTMGWRDAYEVLGIIIAVVSLPLIYFVIRSSPQSMGLSVDGLPDAAPEAGTSRAEMTIATDEYEAGYTMREAFGTMSFWLIFGATFFLVFAASGFGLHVVPFLSDEGLPESGATAVWSAALGVSIGGRFLFGLLSEKYQKRYFASAGNISRTFCLLLLVLFALGAVPQVVAMLQLVILYGLGNGCNAVINPLLISETFGVKAFGKLMGLLGIPYTIGMALGQFMGGHLFDLQGNYNVAFGVFALAFLLAGVAVSLAKPCFLIDTLSVGRKGES